MIASGSHRVLAALGPMRRLMLGLCVLSVSAARSEPPTHAEHALGKVDFPVSCSAAAQAEFNRAVALLHHMTYPQAREAFEHVATVDPRCAMAHWGIAMTLFQPLWPTRPAPAALQRGWDAVQKAKALEPPTERERLFVAAAEAFFLDPASSDYWLRIRRWEEATGKLYAAFPDDPEAAAFYALAHPGDDAREHDLPRRTPTAPPQILLRVYERNPDHPGAMHYLVHANDVPGREHELLEITRKYEAVAPRQSARAAHADAHLHAPRRLGRGDPRQPARGRGGAGVSGRRARRVRLGRVSARDRVPRLRVSAEGRGRRGRRSSSKRLRETARLEPTFKTAFHLGVDAGALRAGAARLERGGRDRAARARDARLGSLRLAGSHRLVRARPGRGALRQADEAQGRGRSVSSSSKRRRARPGEELFARNIRVLRLEAERLARARGGSAGSRASR